MHNFIDSPQALSTEWQGQVGSKNASMLMERLSEPFSCVLTILVACLQLLVVHTHDTDLATLEVTDQTCYRTVVHSVGLFIRAAITRQLVSDAAKELHASAEEEASR